MLASLMPFRQRQDIYVIHNLVFKPVLSHKFLEFLFIAQQLVMGINRDIITSIRRVTAELLYQLYGLELFSQYDVGGSQVVLVKSTVFVTRKLVESG